MDFVNTCSYCSSARRDELIEFVKSLMLTPFVVHSRQASNAPSVLHDAYGEILHSVSQLVTGFQPLLSVPNPYFLLFFKIHLHFLYTW